MADDKKELFRDFKKNHGQELVIKMLANDKRNTLFGSFE
jgi:hypothetical protein